MKLKIEYLPNYNKEWGELGYKHADDACFDMRAAIAEPVTLKRGEFKLFPLGVKLQLVADSDQYEIQVRPRSGLGGKHGITMGNSPATFDLGFRGEYVVYLTNTGPEDMTINPGDRIVQAAICPIFRPKFETVAAIDTNTTRSSGNFGSTGTK